MTEFCRTVREVIESLPEPFAACLENVAVDVEQRPSARTLRRLGYRPNDKHGPLGLFQGIPFTHQLYGERYPNRITLYKRSIEAVSRSREEIAYEIRRTVIHELAHHFGYSEDDLEEFESIESPFDTDEQDEAADQNGPKEEP
jgi:predicted Zn-dependent protease with MMP-like domain